jgi:uncharacterized protein (TIGR02147 family)
MVTPNVFSFDNYREFLQMALPVRGEGRGTRFRLCEFVGFHSGFLTKIIKGEHRLSLEQGLAVAKFFSMNPGETRYFILLLMIDRAGTDDLKQYFEVQKAELMSQLQ